MGAVTMGKDVPLSAAHVIFASNLRRLVDAYGSVSEVSRQSGIGRQQLTKYLSGKALPHNVTRRRLAEFFNVEEEVLFLRASHTSDGQSSSEGATSRSLIEHPQFSTMLRNVENVIYTSLVPGKYLTYFLAEADEGVIVRSLTVVSAFARFRVFRRITGIHEPKRSRWVISKGHHLGVVLERANNIYFSGIDVGGSSVPTLLAVRWAASAKPLLAGSGLVLARNGPANCSVVMEQLPQTTRQTEAIKRCHTIFVDDVDLDPHIRVLLLEPQS